MKKISEYPQKDTFNKTDLYDCSTDIGGGFYRSEKVTEQQLIDRFLERKTFFPVKEVSLNYDIDLNKDFTVIAIENAGGFTINTDIYGTTSFVEKVLNLKNLSNNRITVSALNDINFQATINLESGESITIQATPTLGWISIGI